MSRRRKPKPVPIIPDLDGANVALNDIAQLKRRLSIIESDLNEELDRAKALADEKASQVKERIAVLELSVSTFAEYHKNDLFKDKRSIKLLFGAIGFRRSKELKPQSKNTWKGVLAKIKELKITDAIRTRESVNKDELNGWPDERLKQVGVRRVEKDTFWYEVKEEELDGDAA